MFYKTMSRQIRDHVRAYIKQRIADGEFRQLDPVASSRVFLGMVAHHAQVVALYPYDDVKISNRQMADYFVEIFLDGARKALDSRRSR